MRESGRARAPPRAPTRCTWRLRHATRLRRFATSGRSPYGPCCAMRQRNSGSSATGSRHAACAQYSNSSPCAPVICCSCVTSYGAEPAERDDELGARDHVDRVELDRADRVDERCAGAGARSGPSDAASRGPAPLIASRRASGQRELGSRSASPDPTKSSATESARRPLRWKAPSRFGIEPEEATG